MKRGDWKTEVIINYLGELCIYCNSLEELEINHILPLERGGSNQMSNLEIVCYTCHKEIHRTWDKFFPKKRAALALCTLCGNVISSKGVRKFCTTCNGIKLRKREIKRASSRGINGIREALKDPFFAEKVTAALS